MCLRTISGRATTIPTDPIDVVTGEDGKRELGTMRWGLVPWWSSTNVMIGGHALLVGLTEILPINRLFSIGHLQRWLQCLEVESRAQQKGDVEIKFGV